MERANAYEEEYRVKDRLASSLVIAASILAAVPRWRGQGSSRGQLRILTTGGCHLHSPARIAWPPAREGIGRRLRF